MRGTPRLFGSLALMIAAQGIASTGWADLPGYERDTRAHNLAHGRVVFAENCMRCHESGRKGAPVVGDIDDWRERLEQPLNTLIAHATEGHGEMPARGDRDISDQDVAAAVAYVVNRTRLMAIEDINALPPTAAGPSTDAKTDLSDQAVVQMFLMLIGKDRWR